MPVRKRSFAINVSPKNFEDWQKDEMKKILYTAASSGTIHDQGKMAITLIKKMKSKSCEVVTQFFL